MRATQLRSRIKLTVMTLRSVVSIFDFLFVLRFVVSTNTIALNTCSTCSRYPLHLNITLVNHPLVLNRAAWFTLNIYIHKHSPIGLCLLLVVLVLKSRNSIFFSIQNKNVLWSKKRTQHLCPRIKEA